MIECDLKVFERLKSEAFLIVNLAFKLRPSTAPLESWPSAANQLRMRSLCRRSIFATCFMGSMRERMVRVHQV